jgi:uncharacterized OB-fold protein
MARSDKPVPSTTAESQPFWTGCRMHQLLIQRCTDCGTVQFYPRGLCASCWGDRLEWERSSGTGSIYAFTVVYRSAAPGFKDELPYVLAWIELDEAVQVLANVVGGEPESVRIGMRVEVEFENRTPDITVPRFRPIEVVARATG